MSHIEPSILKKGSRRALSAAEEIRAAHSEPKIPQKGYRLDTRTGGLGGADFCMWDDSCKEKPVLTARDLAGRCLCLGHADKLRAAAAQIATYENMKIRGARR